MNIMNKTFNWHDKLVNAPHKGPVVYRLRCIGARGGAFEVPVEGCYAWVYRGTVTTTCCFSQACELAEVPSLYSGYTAEPHDPGCQYANSNTKP